MRRPSPLHLSDQQDDVATNGVVRSVHTQCPLTRVTKTLMLLGLRPTKTYLYSSPFITIMMTVAVTCLYHDHDRDGERILRHHLTWMQQNWRSAVESHVYLLYDPTNIRRKLCIIGVSTCSYLLLAFRYRVFHRLIGGPFVSSLPACPLPAS
ncbi:hypothetical protein BC629DRAFT_1130078 [Irpex lacteus]|nr:hypothetical protein BC629DRAFT_1130078 [Irpex lacteus]